MKKKYFLFITYTFFATSVYAQKDSRAQIVERISRLPEKELYTSGNLAELGKFVSSKDDSFKLYYPDGSKIDSAVGKKDEIKRSSAFIVARVIIEEEIIPELNKSGDYFYWHHNDYFGGAIDFRAKKTIELSPDWKRLEKKIRLKYGRIHSKRAILWAKTDYYRLTKQYSLLTEALIDFMRKCSVRVYDLENNVAWHDVFANVTDKRLLLRTAKTYYALLLKADQVSRYAIFLDTYANLLYKAGKNKEAINWEQKAVSLEQPQYRKEFEETLAKMKAGAPTWPLKKY